MPCAAIVTGCGPIVQVDGEGHVWLIFREAAVGGKSATIRADALADKFGSITCQAVLAWAKRVKEVRSA